MNTIKNNYENSLKNYYINQEIFFLREIEVNLLSHLILKSNTMDKIIELSNIKNNNHTIGNDCRQRGKQVITLPFPNNDNSLKSIIDDTITYKEDSLLNENFLVISEENNFFIEEYFKSCIKEGITCLYAVSGQLGKDIMYKDNEIKKSSSKITNNNYKSFFSYDKSTNTFVKIYVMKK